MRSRLPFLCAATLAVAVSASERSTRDHPALNASNDGTGGDPQITLCLPGGPEAQPVNAIALVRVPGPWGEYGIQYEIRNLAPRGEAIEHVFLDGFHAAAGRGACFRCATPIVVPRGGTMNVVYPTAQAHGDGPAVISFAGFVGGECAAVKTDVDSNDHAGDLQPSDLVGTRVEIVFKDHLRGIGTLRMCGPRGTLVPETGHSPVPCAPGDLLAIVFEAM
jgi:hypothetical protein